MARNHGAHGGEGLGGALRLPGVYTGGRTIPRPPAGDSWRGRGFSPRVCQRGREEPQVVGGTWHPAPRRHTPGMRPGILQSPCPLSAGCDDQCCVSRQLWGIPHKDQLPTTYPETFEEDEHRKGEAPNFTN